jgi:hypothetical protein
METEALGVSPIGRVDIDLGVAREGSISQVVGCIILRGAHGIGIDTSSSFGVG